MINFIIIFRINNNTSSIIIIYTARKSRLLIFPTGNKFWLYYGVLINGKARLVQVKTNLRMYYGIPTIGKSRLAVIPVEINF